MSTTTELDPFEAAVAAAKGESEEGSSDESLEQEPTVETEPESDANQADEDGDEQAQSVEGPPSDESPEEGESEEETSEDELFGDLEVPELEVEETPQDSFILPGIDEPVSLDELKDGFLRQADYTRKTQELAAQRKDAEQAMRFWEVFTARPKDVAVQLAVEAGLIEAGDQPVKQVDLPFMSEEQIQAEVDKRVEQELSQHPLLKEVQATAAEQWIDSEFARIEGEYEVKLGPASRQKVLQRAAAQETDNLELVFQGMLYEQQRKTASQKEVIDAAPAKPSRKSTGSEQPVEDLDPDADPFEAAVEAAKNTMAARRRRS